MACLDERDRRWREEVARTLAKQPDPVSSMLAFFDLYERFLLRDRLHCLGRSLTEVQLEFEQL